MEAIVVNPCPPPQVLISRAPYMSQQDVIMALWAYGIFAPGAKDSEVPTSAEVSSQPPPQQQLPSATLHAATRSFNSSWPAPGLNVLGSQARGASSLYQYLVSSTSTHPSHASSAQPEATGFAAAAAAAGAVAVGPAADSSSQGASDFGPAWHAQAAAERIASSQGASTSGQAPAQGQAHRHSRDSSSGSSSSSWSASVPSSSSGGDASECSSSGSGSGAVPALVHAMVRSVRLGELRQLPAPALCTLVKALGTLRVGGADVQVVVAAAARAAEARMHELRTAEISNLLYGLSLLKYGDMQVYYASVIQTIRLMEADDSMTQQMATDHKVRGVGICGNAWLGACSPAKGCLSCGTGLDPITDRMLDSCKDRGNSRKEWGTAMVLIWAYPHCILRYEVCEIASA